MTKRTSLAALLSIAALCGARGENTFDYSVVSVPEEGGVRFERITEDADMVTDYGGALVSRRLSWWVLPQLAISPDGDRVAYINERNKTTNVMVKSASRGGASTQRTFRTSVEGVSWSPDGKTLCFTEHRGGHYGVYLVNATQGTVVTQVSNGSDNDLGGVITDDGEAVFFHRQEGRNSFSLWSYDCGTNLFSNYSRGVTVCLIPGDKSTIYCARFTDKRESEIWRVNFETGQEELILSRPGQSFTTPQLSPDGEWLLVTGGVRAEKEGVDNTDIFAVRTNGTRLTQLTYHPGNDLSAVWAPDGKSVYFLSQRGSGEGKYNVWRMDFNL